MLPIQDEYFECGDDEGGDLQEYDDSSVADEVEADQLASEFVGDPDAPFSLREECHPEELVGTLWFSVPEPELIEDPLIEENCVDSAFPVVQSGLRTRVSCLPGRTKGVEIATSDFPEFCISC